MTGAWILGEVSAFQSIVWIAVLPVMFLIWMMTPGRKRNKTAACLWTVIFILAGFGRTEAFLAPDSLISAMERAKEEETFACATGRIERIEYHGNQTVLYLKYTSVVYRQESYSETRLLIYAKEIPKLKIGNQITAEGSLHRYLPPSNPGEFDQQAYYRALHIQAYFYAEEILIKDSAWNNLGQFLQDLRMKLTMSLLRAAGPEEGGVLAGMLLGDKSQMPADIKELYQDAGLAHLIAISGLHISLLGMGMYHFFRRLGLPYLFSSLLGICLMMCYGIMIGGPGAAVRAIIMFGIALAGDWIGRSYDLVSAAGAAALVMLWQSPLSLFQCGFLLSFGAVFGIGLISDPLVHFILDSAKGMKKKLGGALLTGISIQIVSLPITAYFFYEVPAYGIFLNLLVLPLMTFVVLSGGLGALFGLIFSWDFLQTTAIGSAIYLLRFYKWLCKLVLDIPCSRILLGQPKLWQMFLYALVWAMFFLCLCGMKKRNREKERTGRAAWIKWAALAVCLFLSVAVLKRPSVRGLQADFLDVGQGDGIVLQTCGHAVMIDGGSSDVKDVGKYRLEPFLKASGIKRLDYLVMTHCDADHINGLTYLLEDGDAEVKTLVLPAAGLLGKDREKYGELAQSAKEHHILVWWMEAGDSFAMGNASFTCLYPQGQMVPKDSNGSSLVLQCSYEDLDILLMGDLEAEGEEELLRENELSQVDILKVGHHGSKGSTSNGFLEAAVPGWSVISCGKDNRYGHPHEELLERLRQHGVKWWTTRDSGEICITYDGSQANINLWRR